MEKLVREIKKTTTEIQLSFSFYKFITISSGILSTTFIGGMIN